jgi:lipoyl(octanoyl) transferase
LEEAVILTCSQFGLETGRNPVNTGVWVGNRKICAAGVKVRKWVSFHGIALNCDNDLSPFGLIVPCGVRGQYGVTSLSLETKRRIGIEAVKPVLVEAFRKVFAAESAP